MILFTLFIMNLGYKQENNELLYLGLGLPLWFYLTVFYMKLFNKISVESDSLVLKNIFFGLKTIEFKEIEKWEEHLTFNTFSNSLLLRVRGRKIIISNMSDKKNYKILLEKLNALLLESEKNTTTNEK